MTTPAGRRLTEAHRLAQLRLGSLTVERMRAIWRLLDPERLDGTFEDWLTTAIPIIAAQRQASARLAGAYLTALRAIEVGLEDNLTPVLREEPDRQALAASLLVTGPLSVKRAMTRGVSIQQAMGVAEAASAASSMRHALDGGRETITATVGADPRADGYQRVASAGACFCCSKLAGIRFAHDRVFRAHDGCSCNAEPVYR